MENEINQLPLEIPDHAAAEDERLVRACVNGDEQAWNTLIDKYKRLIYSVPVKQGMSPDDAADVFQSVCVELFTNLAKLRKIKSLPSWLITIATHKCYHLHKKGKLEVELDAMEEDATEAFATMPAETLQEIQQEQIVREAIDRLSPRCAEMVKMLFFEQPPVPYNELAKRLGLATGSIGFIRGRCLARLQKILTEMGF
ncbi:MAG: RNA polymerase sigma factor [Acidobacteriia bacterium]|nr:RNA polymerase sigma factor [Terriglobia bacterium]